MQPSPHLRESDFLPGLLVRDSLVAQVPRYVGVGPLGDSMLALFSVTAGK